MGPAGVPQLLWGFGCRGRAGCFGSSGSSELCDGGTADDGAAGGIERRELSDDLRRQLEIRAHPAVACREPASRTSGFAGLRRGHEVSILMTMDGAVG